MKSIIILGFSALAAAQIMDSGNGQFTCPQGAKAFCAGGSLTSNIIIRCSGTTGQPGNCNDNLAGVPPAGVKTSALCYQSSDSAGDAVCSLNGVAYNDDGTTTNIGGGGSSSGGGTSSGGGSSGGSYGSGHGGGCSTTMQTYYTAPAQTQAPAPAPPSPPPPAVSQISDGQVQAGGNAAQQISDGQVQAPASPTEQSAPAATQISDGQVQAGNASAQAAAPASQINDGQVQAGSNPVGQINDGQVQAGNTSAPAQATAGAGHLAASAFSAVVVAFAVAIAM